MTYDNYFIYKKILSLICPLNLEDSESTYKTIADFQFIFSTQ